MTGVQTCALPICFPVTIEIVKATAQRIGNRDYVRVEGWQSIAVAHRWWVKKHFGEQIKITGNLVFARSPEDFHLEIERQNKLIAEGKQ